MFRNKVKNLFLLKQIHSSVSLIKKGKLDKALEALDKAEKSARKAQSSDALYYILFTRGSIFYTSKEYDSALETYEKALEVGSKLLETEPENAEYKHYMGTTISNIGNLHKQKGESQAAAEAYSGAREIYVSLLAQYPENVVYRTYAGENLHNYGTLLLETYSFEKASEILREASEIYENLLLEKTEDSGYQIELSIILSQLGHCLKQLDNGKTEEAKQNLEKALKIQEKLWEEQPENEKIKEILSFTKTHLEEFQS